jgi:predicted phosphodiesterase
MRIAFLSDLHANEEALTACLRHAERAGAARYVFLGDLVGYGPDAAAVVATVQRYVAEGALAVKGNHDQAVERPAHHLDAEAAAAIELARRTLSPEARRFLAELPDIVRDDDITCVHASAAAPARWDYVTGVKLAQESMAAAGTAYTFSGHVHDQRLFFRATTARGGAFRPVPGSPISLGRQRQWLALVGSVGQPRDRDPAAAYALFDRDRAQLIFHRVAYDHHAAARRIRAAGLPEYMAHRIEMGI